MATDSEALAGGRVAAYAGALAVALGVMVCQVTKTQKPVHGADQPDVEELLGQLERLCASLRAAVDEEVEERISVNAAIARPRDSEADRLARSRAIGEATRSAIAVPLRVVDNSLEVLELLLEMTELETTIALTDLTVGAQLALAALRGGACTVLSQLMMSADEEFNRQKRLAVMNAMGRGQEIVHRIEKLFFTAYPL